MKLVFDLYEEGRGQKAITTKLNNDGIRNRNGKVWYTSTVAKILTSTTYVGRHPFRPTNWRTRKVVHRSEWIEISCPPIVEESQFQNVQRLLKERDRRNTPPRTTTSDVLLSKVAVCGSCGGALQLATGTSQNGTVHHYYKCSKKLLTGICPGGNPTSIPRNTLDDIVMEKVAGDLITPERVMEIIARASAAQSSARETASTRIAELKRQLSTAKRKETNLWDLAADGGVKARQGFLQKLDDLQAEIGSLQHQIATQESLVASAVRPLTGSEAAAKSAQMRALLLSADIQRKRRFVHAIIKKVVVNEDEIEIIGSESTLAETASGVNIIRTARFVVTTGSGAVAGLTSQAVCRRKAELLRDGQIRGPSVAPPKFGPQLGPAPLPLGTPCLESARLGTDIYWTRRLGAPRTGSHPDPEPSAAPASDHLAQVVPDAGARADRQS